MYFFLVYLTPVNLGSYCTDSYVYDFLPVRFSPDYIFFQNIGFKTFIKMCHNTSPLNKNTVTEFTWKSKNSKKMRVMLADLFSWIIKYIAQLYYVY